MNEIPIILTFQKFYLPGYRAGGPIRTLANMVSRLGQELDFRIVTLDRDIGDHKPYPDVVRRKWDTVGNAEVLYLGPDELSIRRLVEIVKEVAPDVIYLNSFFDCAFTQRVLWARRLGKLPATLIVLAPRGEFSSGALGLKLVKKSIYLHFVKIAGLYKNIVWQASSDLERSDISRALPFAQDQIKVALDLAPTEDGLTFERKLRAQGAPLQVCFLSRVSPMKNLDFALKALAEVSLPLVFTIYGPKELASYWKECESLIKSMPANIKVIYKGEVHPSEVKLTLSEHDIFFLPSRGENFGHVIHEALGAGLPVLISDQTPWCDVVKRGIGWTYPLLSIDPYVKVLEECCSWNNEKWARTAQEAVLYAKEKAADPEVFQSNRQLFFNAVSSDARTY